ncbi:MAG: non-canonical purine NTP pyrophosphatase [Bacteroidales bacterium]|nr:non-canonical purine NTP pyrophosphatase [Bacteroidales bacterium]
MDLVFATGNAHKLREAGEILGMPLRSAADCGVTEEIPETADTIAGNSAQKAEYLYARTGCDCFADDTGLEVDALDGAPGVYTARFAARRALLSGHPEEAAAIGHDFDANMDALLAELALRPDAPRTARFRSVVTLIVNGEKHCFEGTMEGRIALAKCGRGGFGYDPVFIADDYPDVTVAELPEETKNAISHRGKALRAMAAWLRERGE